MAALDCLYSPAAAIEKTSGSWQNGRLSLCVYCERSKLILCVHGFSKTNRNNTVGHSRKKNTSSCGWELPTFKNQFSSCSGTHVQQSIGRIEILNMLWGTILNDFKQNMKQFNRNAINAEWTIANVQNAAWLFYGPSKAFHNQDGSALTSAVHTNYLIVHRPEEMLPQSGKSPKQILSSPSPLVFYPLPTT